MLYFPRKSNSAAKTQLEYNHNPDDARRLLLRAIRHHPKSQKIWTEYFRMELLHAYKLNQRMAILQQSQMTLEGDETSLLKGELAGVVYKKAVEAIPDDIPFRLLFAKISQDFDFAKHITDEIYKDLQTTHPEKEQTWDALARRPLTLLTKVADESQIWKTEQACHKIYQDGLEKTPSVGMWNLFIGFLHERLLLGGSRDTSDQRLKLLLSTLAEASNHVELSEENFQLWMDAHVNCGQIDEAVAIAEKATTSHVRSAAMWEMHLRLVMRKFSPDEADSAGAADQICNLFDQAVSNVKSKHALSIWNVGLDWCLLHDRDRVEVIFEAACKEHRNVAIPFKECYLEFVAINRGLKKMRKVYRKLKVDKPVSVDFFKRKIFLERTQPEANTSKLREAYEDALREYGSNQP
ncbi:putative U3 small nucleolar RNA-associated protein 6-like, partial [Apostichopus japonicus]